MKPALVAVLGTALCAVGTQAAQPTAAPPQPGFVWAEACKSCHAEQFEAWSKTKHARALERLSHEERQAESRCVGCHITGLKTPLASDGQVVNAGVQCEACHGPGRDHVEAATAGRAPDARMVATPAERTCTGCHSEASPHFRGFFYSALKALVHR
ncbi:MAG: multiheme c-type cytochrome [Vicinamibacterales bacterium]